MKTIRWGITGSGDVCEMKRGPAFQKVEGDGRSGGQTGLCGKADGPDLCRMQGDDRRLHLWDMGNHARDYLDHVLGPIDQA
jgi:hypothetical protein